MHHEILAWFCSYIMCEVKNPCIHIENYLNQFTEQIKAVE